MSPKPEAPGPDNDRPTAFVVPWRLQGAVYAIGTFANSTNNVVSVILPLWALALGASPLMIGIILGARHLLTLLLSIHGGALMDRIGTRRILVVSGVAAVLSPLAFPLMPWIWAAILLQMLGGLASNYGWIGAQAQIGQVMRGSPTHAGRLSFCLRIGQVAAPPLAGFAWDIAGPWGGFGVLALWGGGLLLASMALPEDGRSARSGTGKKTGAEADKTAEDRKSAASGGGSGAKGPRLRLVDLLPRPGDYIEAFRMLAVPAILLVVMVTVLRMGGNGMKGSFYVVYLEQIGYTGTLIGVLVGAAGLLGFAGSLSVGPLLRLMSGYWLLVATVTASIVLVSITPLIGSVFSLLLIASALRGGTMGLSQPLMISILAKAAGEGRQGKGVALRTTANRLASLVVPIVMGLVMEMVGIEASFYIVGGILVLGMLAVALHVRRAPGFRS